MTPLFPAQHAAEEFDSVLEGRATTAVAERYADLVDTVQVLREQPEVMPRAEFVADLRSRLMTAAATEMVPADPVVRRLPTKARRNRRWGTAAAALVIVGGSAGMAAAASGALPGESLYPIKRGVEQVEIAAHFGDASRGSALLDQADTRLGELQALLAANSDDALVDATAADFRDSANSGADKLFRAYQTDAEASDIATVRDFTSGAMSEVATMATGADPAVSDELRDVADTLIDIDQQAATLCGTCGGGEVLTTPDALASAAAAGSVVSLVARPSKQASADISQAAAANSAPGGGATSPGIGDLRDSAQGAADKIGKATGGATGSGSLANTLTSTLTSTGDLVPSLTASGTTAVNGLVGGITSTVTGGGGGGGTSPGDVVDKTKDTVGGVTDKVGETVDDATKGILP